MGAISGDKSRYHRERRKKIARRVSMRALRAEASNKETASAPAKARSGAKPAKAPRPPA